VSLEEQKHYRWITFHSCIVRAFEGINSFGADGGKKPASFGFQVTKSQQAGSGTFFFSTQ
jgi:hypothetical protein